MADQGRSIDDETIHRIVTMRVDDVPHREISRECKVSTYTINKYAPPWIVRLAKRLIGKNPTDPR